MIHHSMTARRVAGRVPGVVALVALAVVTAACKPASPGVITLVTPAANAIVTQNDPVLATQCPANAARGTGYVIEFSWTLPSDVSQFKRYQVVLQHGSSIPIELDVDGASTTSFTHLSCNSFVIDTNLSGWHWQVNALGNGDKVVASSEQRALTFGPCRLADATPCNAPPA